MVDLENNVTTLRSPAGGEAAAVGVAATEPTGRDRLAGLMAAMAAGDPVAPFRFLECYERELTRAIRRVANSRGAYLGPDEIQGLVVDVALEIARLSPAWKPDGAAPWYWGRHRIENVVDRSIGQWADPFDEIAEQTVESSAPAPAADDGRSAEVVAEALAAENELVALLLEAVRLVASDRDVGIFFETLVQKGTGSGAHADAVARLFGVPSTTVRQQFRRVFQRVLALADRDPRFAPLASLAAVA